MKTERTIKFALAVAFILAVTAAFADAATSASSKGHSASEKITTEWNQWGGSPTRNNTPVGNNIPTQWNIGSFDYRTGAWDSSKAKNIKWVARLGSQTYGNPVVAGGHAYIGTNNSAGWLKRYPQDHDLGVLL